jgi:alpha-glucosidase
MVVAHQTFLVMHTLQRSFSTSLTTIFLLLAGVLFAAPLKLERQASIDEGVAWFWPEGVDAGTLPSFALLEEPAETGPVPDEWLLVPSWESHDGKVTATIKLPVGAHLYGTGEVTGPLVRNGQTIELWNTDNYMYSKADGKRLYQSHPWVLGLHPDGRGFGVIFDTIWRAQLTTRDDAIVFASEGPAFRVIVIEAPSPQAVLAKLAELTGHMPLTPRWSLGFQQSKYSYFPDHEVRRIADEFRSRELPCDVIWMDIDYMDGFRIFTFDEARFPDPSATNAYLHEHGFKGVWMIDPGVKMDPGYFVYDEGTDADLWVHAAHATTTPFIGEVWPGDCVFPDYTMAETRQWWSGLYDDFMATGIDGVWNDMNEPSVFNGPEGTMDPNAWHRGDEQLPPGPHLRYHNVYGMLMVKASRAGILAANPDKRPFILTRSNFLGGQRYAATWTGDNQARWEHLKMSIPMTLNLGLSGQPFNGPDIGGFTLGGDPVLYGHWIALGTFYPFSRAHVDNTPGEGNEPWAYGPAIERVAQTALFRRYRLLPYFYTLMEASSLDGQPIMRPVFFADPADPALRQEEEAFLLGGDLLVVPQWARHPAMPKGNWRPVQLLAGEREADGYQPQLFLRPGAILPLGEVAQNTTEAQLDPLTLLVALDADGFASGTLYHDAGDGFAYQHGQYARLRFEARRASDGSVEIKVAEVSGELSLKELSLHVQLITDEGVQEGRGSLEEGVLLLGE